MDRVSICWSGKTYGELTTYAESLYTWFRVRCRLPDEGIWAVWVVGEEGELRLGIPEPCGGEAELRRRFSQRMTAPAGKLLRGELRPVTSETAEVWKRAEPIAWRTPWLRENLQRTAGALTRSEGEVRLLAVPYSEKEPFPLVPLFCFSQVRRVEGRLCAVFAFDREERPLFPETGPMQGPKP